MERYIDADILEKYIANGLNNPDKNEAFGFDAVQILSEIHYIPTADVREVKHGKWIYKYKGTCHDDVAYCSLCNFYCEDKINNIGQCFHFCPNCGADMRSE